MVIASMRHTRAHAHAHTHARTLAPTLACALRTGAVLIPLTGQAVGCRIMWRKGAVEAPELFFSIDSATNQPSTEHHHEGRIIYAKFKENNTRILHTYTPNQSDFEKRRTWDVAMTKFVAQESAAPGYFAYCGDLNCAPTDADLSHPKWYVKGLLGCCGGKGHACGQCAVGSGQ